MSTEIKDKIKNFLIEQFSIPREKFDEKLNLLDGWIVDSIHLLSVVHFLENEFKIDIVAEDMQSENFINLTTIMNFIRSKGIVLA